MKHVELRLDKIKSDAWPALSSVPVLVVLTVNVGRQPEADAAEKAGAWAGLLPWGWGAAPGSV